MIRISAHRILTIEVFNSELEHVKDCAHDFFTKELYLAALLWSVAGIEREIGEWCEDYDREMSEVVWKRKGEVEKIDVKYEMLSKSWCNNLINFLIIKPQNFYQPQEIEIPPKANLQFVKIIWIFF